MKKPQWIAVAIGIVLVAVIFLFGNRTDPAGRGAVAENQPVEDGAHEHPDISTDTILALAKKNLEPRQLAELGKLENSVGRGDVKAQQLSSYHRLAAYWADSAGYFEPSAWYTAEAARLENSEKSLTFAAHLFLDNLQRDDNPALIRWRALQAKDLFERSLKINPDNDSSNVGLGACYLFGNISDAPMEGIAMIRKVVEKDSTNLFAQITLAKGAMYSQQFERAADRLQTILRLQPSNLEAKLLLAEAYERMGQKADAVQWYQESLKSVDNPQARQEISKRIEQLKK